MTKTLRPTPAHLCRSAIAAGSSLSLHANARDAQDYIWNPTRSVQTAGQETAAGVVELAVQRDGGVDQRQMGDGLGEVPSCSPVRPISSAYSPRWLA